MNKSSYVYEYDIIKISNMPEFAYLFMTQGNEKQVSFCCPWMEQLVS